MSQTTPYGTKYKFFLMHGNIPLRQLGVEEVPEILHPDGAWHPFRDTYRFHHEAKPVSKEAFDAAVANMRAKRQQEN